MTRRLLLASVAGALVLALLLGEGGARIALAHRLDGEAGSAFSARFVGTSALLALATRTLPLRIEADVDALAETIAENTDGALTSVESTDGLLGLHFDDGLGPLPGPATAWVALTVQDDAVVAEVVSLGVGELQFQPGAVLGGDLAFDVPLGQGRCVSGTPIDDVTVTDDAVELDLTVSADTLGCLENQENS